MASSRVAPTVALLLTLFLSSALLPIVHTKTVELTIFEFEDRIPPNNTIVFSTPSGNFSQLEFGNVLVVSNVLRESMESNSTVLGSLVGLVNVLRDNIGLYLTVNFVYESPDYNGTIGVQGLLNTTGFGELVVTGGSGDFRLARGWCDTAVVEGTDPANIVIKNVVHLEF